ncbi:MAG: hypothetical protein FWE20_10375 [Defluviitaleaceae bacterium]|nr:hypothetical protein [Defluviitaleaceae bacterium]
MLKVIKDKNALRLEILRLKLLADELHQKLSKLKRQRFLNRLNSLDYSAIEKEMMEISQELGYSWSGGSSRQRQFREAPSKSIRVYLGGRGG